jgi:hypothetical protein
MGQLEKTTTPSDPAYRPVSRERGAITLEHRVQSGQPPQGRPPLELGAFLVTASHQRVTASS